MGLGAVLGGAQVISNIAGQRSAQRANKKNMKKALGAYQGLDAAQARLYRQAFGELDRYGASAKADILDNQRSVLAGNEQDFASRGLYHTTGRTSTRTGIAHSTNRSLAALNEQIGAMRAGLYTDLARLKTQAAAGQAGIYQGTQYTSSGTDILGSLNAWQTFMRDRGWGNFAGTSAPTPSWGVGPPTTLASGSPYTPYQPPAPPGYYGPNSPNG